MTSEQRIAAALAVLDKPRACVADLASVNAAVAILRGEDGLRAGEYTATHTGPLSAEVLQPAIDYFTDDEIALLVSAAKRAADEHIACPVGTDDAFRDLADKVALLRGKR